MAKGQTVKSARREWVWVVTFVVTLMAIATSGLAVVNDAHETRGLYQALGETQQQQDELLADHSRLLLERGARSSLQNIEEVAQRELNMQFPVDGQVIE